MTIVRHVASKYIVRLCINNKNLLMKFDTGAQFTVISFRSLYPDIPKDKAKVICNKLSKSTPRKFLLANGEYIDGILFRADKGIKIGDRRISNFYFYLILDTDNKIELLGDDFISGCSFNHNIDGDIMINAINDHIQEKTFNKLESVCYELDSLELWRKKML